MTGRRASAGPRLRPVLAVAALAVLLVTAGCAAPKADPGAPAVATEGGNLSVDPGTEYARLRALLGTNVSAPSSVTVLNVSTVPNRSGGDARASATFRAFGVEPRPGERGEVRYRYVAATAYTGQVRLAPGEKPTPLVRTVLVHEYVHYVQLKRGDQARLRETLDTRTTEGAFVSRAVVEGIAVDVTDAYVARHVPDAAPNSRLYERIDAALPRGTPAWYANAVYRFGARYVDDRADDPAAALAVAARPPRTAEQVIHGYAPGVEPRRPLTVSVDRTGTAWRSVGRDRLGEAFLLAALGDLPADRARRAAAGWGADELVILRSDGVENASYALAAGGTTPQTRRSSSARTATRWRCGASGPTRATASTAAPWPSGG